MQTDIDIDKHQQPECGFSTAAIHAGQAPERWGSRAVVPPIVTATTYQQIGPNEHEGFCYSRGGNPTRAVLEACLAAIERSRYAYTFASGMGAVSAILGLIGNGDHLLTSKDVYGGTTRLLREVTVRNGVDITYVDFTDAKQVQEGLRPNTKMIWMESPTNPLLKVVDIAEISALARVKSKDVIIVVDNTFLTPYFQRPLELGADISMYSLTKYMNGHSDVIMGSACVNDPDLAIRMKSLQNTTGIVPSPFDCYLVNRSLKTLALRMDRHRAGGLAVAHWLTDQPSVTEVMHPELPSHPQYAITKKQSTGHSGLVSFRHRFGVGETRRLLQALGVFTLAESLGGYESLAALPCEMSHGSLPADTKQELGITDNLIRLSVGLEDVNDLLEDLKQAFAKAFPVIAAPSNYARRASEQWETAEKHCLKI